MRNYTIVPAIAAVLLAICVQAQAQQTRLYGADGRSVGTATPSGNGSTRYHDERGRSTGTSTTSNGTTTFYDSRGRVIGRSTAPPDGRR
jgi:YD repeat-containing protein